MIAFYEGFESCEFGYPGMIKVDKLNKKPPSEFPDENSKYANLIEEPVGKTYRVHALDSSELIKLDIYGYPATCD